MSAKPLTNEQIKQKKRKQAVTSQVTGGLGLAALGGTALATRRGQRVLAAGYKRAGRPVPQNLTSSPKPKGLDRTITPLLATSAGIGAMGSFNFAQYTRAEADKGKKRVQKNWTPATKQYDPEGKRHRRNQNLQTGLTVASAGTAAGATGMALRSAGQQGRANEIGRKMGPLTEKQATKVKTLNRGARKSLKTGGLLLAGSAAAATGEAVVRNRRNSKSWESYSKSAPSAFGIQH